MLILQALPASLHPLRSRHWQCSPLSFISGQWLLPYTFPHILFMAEIWCYKSYKYYLWHQSQGFEHQFVFPTRPQGWEQNRKTHQVSVRHWGTTERGEEMKRTPRVSYLPLSILISHFLPHEEASQARQQPSLSGTTAPSQPSRWHQWELLCCQERSLLCQNLKLAQGDATGAGITPVVAVKDLGSCSTEVKNPQPLLVGPYLLW